VDGFFISRQLAGRYLARGTELFARRFDAAGKLLMETDHVGPRAIGFADRDAPDRAFGDKLAAQSGTFQFDPFGEKRIAVAQVGNTLKKPEFACLKTAIHKMYNMYICRQDRAHAVLADRL